MRLKVVSIRKIHKALVSDGYCISEDALRKWVKQGLISASYSGNTAYVSYDSIVTYLLGTTKQN